MSLIDTREIATAKIVMLSGGGSATALTDLTDTNISNPSNGQLLGYNSTSGKWENVNGGGSGGDNYAGLGIGKKASVTNNVIDTDIDLHRAPIAGDRLLIYFDAKVVSPTGVTTYNNGTAVTCNLENIIPRPDYYAGWNILEFKNDGLLYNNVWTKVQNVQMITTLSGLSDTLITSPSDGQMLAYDNSTSKWKNKTIAPNNSGTPVRELETLQIGDVVFNAFGLKSYDVASISSGAIRVSVLSVSQVDGEIVAVSTGSNTGTTSSAWTLALSDGMITEPLTMSKGGSAFTDAITANSLIFVKCDTTNSTATVLGIIGGGTEVSANPSASATTYLNKIKVGNGVYDATAIKPCNVSSISNGGINLSVINVDQLVGKIIAVSTGSNTGTTSNAWKLNLSDGGMFIDINMTNADGTAFTDEITANELLFVYVDTDNDVATVLSVVGKSDDEIKTVTGNPITLTDAIAGNAISVSAEITAEQDLHGYDKPWVGGAGKNKIPMTTASIKELNGGASSWTGNKKTISNAEVEILEDAAGNVMGIKINGTTNANIILQLAPLQNLRGDYVLNGCPSGGGTVDYEVCLIDSTLSRFVARDFGEGTSVTIAEDYIPRVVVRMNVTLDNAIFYPMLRPATVTDATFEPYTNICPITGHSSVTITDEDAEGQTTTTTVSLGSTIYGGTADITGGSGEVTHGYIASYNGETINTPWISDKSAYEVGATPITGAQVVYPLTSPTALSTTPTAVTLAKGQNTLSCSSGDMSITYKASGLDALKERVDELEDAVEDLTADVASKTENSVVGNVENGTTASQAYAVGEHFIRNDAFCTAIATIASGATLTLGTNYVEGTIAEAVTNKYNYSTTEHVVGTWIDGKTLYERTFEAGYLPNGTYTFYSTGIPISSFPLTNIKRVFGIAVSSSDVLPLPYANGGTNSQAYDAGLAPANASGYFAFYMCCGVDRSSYKVYATVQYTKS